MQTNALRKQDYIQDNFTAPLPSLVAKADEETAAPDFEEFMLKYGMTQSAFA